MTQDKVKIGIDFVGPLPHTKQGNQYLLVATEYLTKWVEVKATARVDADTVAKFILEEIISQHGCPHELILDQGTHFLNQMIAILLKKMGIKHQLASPYHPQTNGLTEQFNKTLCEMLARMTKRDKTNWDEMLPMALLSY